MSFSPGQLEGLGGERMENQIENPLLQKTPEACPGGAAEEPRRHPQGAPEVPQRCEGKDIFGKKCRGGKIMRDSFGESFWDLLSGEL